MIRIQNLLENAMKPVGTTLYVWGGGWNEADDGAGECALYEGLWPEWEKYYTVHRRGYSYKPGRLAWENGDRSKRCCGLDCSGYLGWALYNSVEKCRRKNGYVIKASIYAQTLAQYGYGKVAACAPSDSFIAGDIVSIKGHCFLCVDQFSDESVLLLHATPNGGVQMSGTVRRAVSSIAERQAGVFMRENYPLWWECFGAEGRQAVSAELYLSGMRFRWDG